MSYYSTANYSGGNTTPGNFGISNAIRVGVQGNVGNYNISLNNAGLLPQTAGVNTNTNVMMGILSNQNGQTNTLPPVEQVINNSVNAHTFNGNVLNEFIPKIQMYASEKNVNTYQN